MNTELTRRIAAHPFLHAARPDHLEIIGAGAVEVTFPPEHLIFREREPANRCYLIESGQVALEARGPDGVATQLQVLGEGEVLGWSWLFPPYTWHFQARTLGTTRALALDGGHLLAASERDPAFGYELMKRVSQVVLDRLQAARRKLCARW
jgi:CRP-like cAMP-binding protein